MRKALPFYRIAVPLLLATSLNGGQRARGNIIGSTRGPSGILPAITILAARCFSTSSASLDVLKQSSTEGTSRFSHAFTKRDVLALDFDGVICASAEESSGTAVEAARSAWDLPLLANDISGEKTLFKRIQSMVKAVRPVIESGFENVLIARFFYDSLTIDGNPTRPSDDEITQSLLQTWSPELRDHLLTEYERDRASLVKIFGETRDRAIANDLTLWAKKNTIYPHIQKALMQSETEKGIQLDLNRTFIITTKQERFLKAILKENDMLHYLAREKTLPSVTADIIGLSSAETQTLLVSNTDPTAKTLPLDQVSNIFDLENIYGSKPNVLVELVRRLSEQDGKDDKATIHFVEDRFETLVKIVKLRREERDRYALLDRVRLYLVDWGYNTEEQRQQVSHNSHMISNNRSSIEVSKLLRDEIILLSPNSFVELLKEFE